MNHHILENTDTQALAAPDQETGGSKRFTPGIGWVLAWGLAAILAFALAALLSAMIGVFSPLLVIVVGSLGTFGLRRVLPQANTQPTSVPAALTVVALTMTVCVYGWLTPHEHVLAGRDSGTYVATAAWIATEGTLSMRVGDPILERADLVFESTGFPSLGDNDNLKPQFLHLWPALMAFTGAVSGGLHGVFLATPLVAAVGVIAFFAFVSTLASTRVALFSTLLVVATFPFLYFYRAPFSETLAFTFLFGGLWALQAARRSQSHRLAAGAGVLLGSVGVVRLDGILILLGLTAYLALLQADSSMQRDRRHVEIVERTWSVTAAMLVLSVVDAALFSPHYLSVHGTLVAPVVALILAFRFLAGPISEVYRRYKSLLANGLAALTGLFLVYAALLRPYTAEPTRSDVYGIEALQMAAGVPLEPLRSYAELSVHWLVWYLGIPLVVLGLMGLVIEIRRVLLSPNSAIGPFVTIAVTSTLLYLYRPSINPDHIWAMRRFVPLVIPGLVVLAVILVVRATSRLDRGRAPVLFTLCAALLLGVIPTTSQAGIASEFSGANVDMTQACERLGEGSILIFVGESAPALFDALGPPLRGFCDVVVAAEATDNPLSDLELEAIKRGAATDGRTLWLSGGSVVERPGEPITVLEGSYDFLELTLFGAPQSWENMTINLTAQRESP